MRLLIFAGVASGRHATRQPLKKCAGDQGIINGHITCISMLAQWLFADTSVIGVMPRPLKLDNETECLDSGEPRRSREQYGR